MQTYVVAFYTGHDASTEAATQGTVHREVGLRSSKGFTNAVVVGYHGFVVLDRNGREQTTAFQYARNAGVEFAKTCGTFILSYQTKSVSHVASHSLLGVRQTLLVSPSGVRTNLLQGARCTALRIQPVRPLRT